VDNRILLHTRSSGKSEAPRTANDTDRWLDHRACEAALWLALVSAERAGFLDLLIEIASLHATVGMRRRKLEATA
jgi:hypothetical protein